MGDRRFGEGGATPAWGWAPRPPASLPEVAGGETPCVGCGFRFCSGIGCFWAGGGGSVLITLVLYVLFCCSSILYQCQEGGAKSLFGPPQINCHIPKLRSSPWSVSFLLAGTVVQKAQAMPPPLQRGKGGPGPQQWGASAPAHFQAPPVLPRLHLVS